LYYGHDVESEFLLIGQDALAVAIVKLALLRTEIALQLGRKQRAARVPADIAQPRGALCHIPDEEEEDDYK
jgi:hypothetical protein